MIRKSTGFFYFLPFILFPDFRRYINNRFVKKIIDIY